MRIPTLAGVLLVAVLLSSGVVAQQPSSGAVVGRGSAEVRRQPNVLRVQVEVLAKGKTLKEALDKLRTVKEASRTRLLALGAVKETVRTGEATVGSERSEQQARMEAMVAARMRAGGKSPPKSKQAAPAVVSVVLVADLPLEASNTEELLLRAQELQDKIKSADLGNLKEFEKVSPQEEEIAEENQAMEMMRGEQVLKRGEPTFLFVARIADADYTKALAEAFKKARDEATQLVGAAGGELGRLQSLENNSQGGGPDDGNGEDPRFYRRGVQPQPSLPPLAERGREAVGHQPGSVTYRVAVTATFAINMK